MLERRLSANCRKQPLMTSSRGVVLRRVIGLSSRSIGLLRESDHTERISLFFTELTHDRHSIWPSWASQAETPTHFRDKQTRKNEGTFYNIRPLTPHDVECPHKGFLAWRPVAIIACGNFEEILEHMNRLGHLVLLVAFLVPLARVRADDTRVPAAKPETLGVSTERLDRIDGVINQAVEKGDLPGAVVIVVHRGHVVFRRAYGQRSKQPVAVPMTVDTVFDLASLTKPVAAAPSIMLLVEQGKLSLSDPVAKHLPAFAAQGKDKITIEQLLLHTSGLIADNAEADFKDGKKKAIERICNLKPQGEPGTRFIYSDVNFIVLGELVEHVSGTPLDEFARKNFYKPLGMTETGFRPPDALKERIAPTAQRDGHWMVGEVHDPRAYLLGGVAGHAGLFSTADDLAVFAQMMLNGGQWHDQRVLSALTVKTMTTPREVPKGLRAYGWDVQTTFSTNRGELSKPGSGFGHTGFTGTSIWIDPDSETAVIFLSNRVHPDGKGSVVRLRGQVATLAAAALGPPPKRAPQPPEK
jgi:serine-type D-Ala-D-Ala carboxypeptidase